MARKTPLPTTYLLAAIVAMFLFHHFFPAKRLIGFPWNLVGGLPLLAGILLNLCADRSFKRRKTTVKPFEESTALITTGVFRVSRNPMYLGFELILLGIGLLLGSLTPWTVVVVFPVVVDRVFITVEERMLEGKFSDFWRAYRSGVRRWI